MGVVLERKRHWGGGTRERRGTGGRGKERETSMYVCESLSGYYGNCTGLSDFLQNHFLRRLELFSL